MPAFPVAELFDKDMLPMIQSLKSVLQFFELLLLPAGSLRLPLKPQLNQGNV